MNIRNHINKFNKFNPQLLSVNVKIDKKNQSITLLASLPKSYNTMVTMFLIRKTTFFADEVSTTL